MARIKTFFKYLILIIGFFIISQILIYLSIITSYSPIPLEDISEEYVIIGEAKAKKIAGYVKFTVKNPQEIKLKDKYIKLEYYSKSNNLLGIDYIETGEIGAKEEKEYEINFQYERIKSVKIDIVDNKEIF